MVEWFCFAERVNGFDSPGMLSINFIVARSDGVLLLTFMFVFWLVERGPSDMPGAIVLVVLTFLGDPV